MFREGRVVSPVFSISPPISVNIIASHKKSS
jgi:hypothetical protein